MLISQLGRATPGAQAVVSEMLRQWQDEIEAGVRHLQDAGEVGAEVDAERTAAALLAGIQGGVVVMLSTGGRPPGSGARRRDREPAGEREPALTPAPAPGSQADLIAEISNSRVTLSLTRTPPVSRAAFQVMP